MSSSVQCFGIILVKGYHKLDMHVCRELCKRIGVPDGRAFSLARTLEWRCISVQRPLYSSKQAQLLNVEMEAACLRVGMDKVL